MIYQTINNASQLLDAFNGMNRGNTFTYEGYKALYSFLEDSGDDIELDVISLCCDFAEYGEEALIKEYGSQADSEELEEVLDYLKDNTTLIETGVSYIVQSF